MRVANLANDTEYNIQQSEQVLAAALQQVSTGLRVSKPSDDPAASANLVTSLAASATIDQYTSNITAVTAQAQTADSALSSVISSLTSAVSLGTAGGNGTSTSENSQNLASQVETLLSGVVSDANTSYQGAYVFGGSASTSTPVLEAAASYETQNAQVDPPLTATLPLTAGSTVVLTNAATGRSFVYTVTAGETITDFTESVVQAAASGTLPSGTTASISGGQLLVSSGSSTQGIAVSSNDPVFGRFSPVAGTTLANQYAYVGNSTVNTVQASNSLSVASNIPGNQIFTGGASAISALQGLVTALQSGTQTNIQTATQAVATALHNVTQARIPFENGISQLNSEESFLSQEKVTLTSQQTSLVGSDLATAATNLSLAETQNSAVLAAAAKVLPQTLLNYVSPA